MPLVKIADTAPGLLDARAAFRAPEDPKQRDFGEVVASAFRTENLIGSALAAQAATGGVDNSFDPTYNAWDDVKGTKYEAHFDSFVDANNAEYAAALKAKLDQEMEDRETLNGAGAFGMVASLGAGLADPTILIPGAGVVKSVKGGYSLGKSALSVGLDAATGAAISEAGLHATQELRTGTESTLTIGGSVLLGGLLGAGTAKLLTKAEQKQVLAAYDTLNNITGPRAAVSAGAASVDLASRADLSPSTGAGFGGAAAKLAEATQFSPNLRLQQSPSAAVRRTGQGLAENTLYQSMHDEGRTLGAAVETVARVEYGRRMASAKQVHEALFKDMHKGGIAMSRQDFEEAVGRAMRNGDQALDGNEYVSKAAQAWRERLFDPFKEEAIRLGQLPADVGVDTAASYFTRVWNRERLTADEFGFKQRVANWYAAHIGETYRASVENRARRIAALDQELADLRLAPDERVRTLEQLKAEGDALDAINPDAVDRVTRINELRAQAKAAKDAGDAAGAKAAKAEILRIEQEGGKSLKSYKDQRRNLRRRKRNVDLNYAGMMDRVDRIMDSLVELEEANFRSLNRLVERGRRFELEVRNLDPEGQQKKIASLRGMFMDAAEKADKAIERTRKQVEALGEESPEAKAKLEKAALAEAARSERLTSLARRLEAAEALDPEAAVAEIREAVDALTYEVSHLSLGRGEKAQRLKDRLARLDTKQIDDRVKAVEALKSKIERNFYDQWEVRHGADLSVDAAEAPPPVTGNLDLGNEYIAKHVNHGNNLHLVDLEGKTRLADAPNGLRTYKDSRGIHVVIPSDKGYGTGEAAEVVATLKPGWARPDAPVRRVEHVVVSPEYQGQGLGRFLLETAEREYPNLKLDTSHDGDFSAAGAKLFNKYNAAKAARTVAANPDFSQAGRDIADDVFDKLTGRAGDAANLPEYLTPITRGPLKDRTFNVPDALVEDFLESNVMSVAERYGRQMAAETELTRRFGRADLRDQTLEIRDDYRGLREAVEAAADVDAAREVAGAPKGLKDKAAIQKWLADRETADLKDIGAIRDLVRGTYQAGANASHFGRTVRGLMAFNYIRQMGGALIANFAELYRPAMVHGLGRYMSEGVAPLMAGMKGVKASVKEAQLLGQVTERVLQHRVMSMGEIGDPYRSGTPVERFLQNMTRVGSKFNGLVYWTDAQKAISSVLSQNRILDGAVTGKDPRTLAYLGIDADMAGRIAKQFGEHGETVDGVKVANTEAWDDAAAVRAYRAAVSKDVDSTIVTKSVGDAPLFVNTPAGKMLAQFKNYMFASHQRVLLRGMQESKARFVSGMVAMSALGMLAATARSWRGGEERFDKFKEASTNPGYLIAEGLDNSGIFALPFEAAGITEKMTGVNPLKLPAKGAGLLAPGEQSMMGDSTRFASRGLAGAIGGPTVGLADGLGKTAVAGLNAAKEGRGFTPAEKRTAIGLLPGSTYVGWREMLQAMAGDSPYTPE